jgi:hypothetical protein
MFVCVCLLKPLLIVRIISSYQDIFVRFTTVLNVFYSVCMFNNPNVFNQTYSLRKHESQAADRQLFCSKFKLILFYWMCHRNDTSNNQHQLYNMLKPKFFSCLIRINLNYQLFLLDDDTNPRMDHSLIPFSREPWITDWWFHV